MFLEKLKFGKKTDEDSSSEFSRFFRTASSGEKKRVFIEIARKASEDQRKIFKDETFTKNRLMAVFCFLTNFRYNKPLWIKR